MQPDRYDREGKAELASSLDQEWTECCRNFAELIMPPLEEMIPGAFNEQKRNGEVNDLTKTLSSHEFIALLSAGFQQLTENRDAEAQQFISQITEKMESASLSVDTANLVNLTTFLQIDDSLISFVEKTALDELEKKEPAKATPLFVILAFLQNQKAEAWFQLGFSLYQEENYPLAHSAILSAIALQPEQPEYSVLLAAIYAMQNDKKEAKEALENVEKILHQHHLTLSEEWKQLKENIQMRSN